MINDPILLVAMAYPAFFLLQRAFLACRQRVQLRAFRSNLEANSKVDPETDLTRAIRELANMAHR